MLNSVVRLFELFRTDIYEEKYLSLMLSSFVRLVLCAGKQSYNYGMNSIRVLSYSYESATDIGNK